MAQTAKSQIGLIGLAVMGQVSARCGRLGGLRRRRAASPACSRHLPPRSRQPRAHHAAVTPCPRTPTAHHSSDSRRSTQNLALNVAEKGFSISVYNRSGDKTDAAVARAKKEGVGERLHGAAQHGCCAQLCTAGAKELCLHALCAPHCCDPRQARRLGWGAESSSC